MLNVQRVNPLYHEMAEIVRDNIYDSTKSNVLKKDYNDDIDTFVSTEI